LLARRGKLSESALYPTEDRDVNAAINILKLALCTAGHAGTYAWGDLPSWAIGAILSFNGESANQESPHL
ncbi:MAG: transposase, partial [Coleofasciculus sp. Co-bin14]|nr:transposase [Coleofasciculus sp. Co-bin14]